MKRQKEPGQGIPFKGILSDDFLQLCPTSWWCHQLMTPASSWSNHLSKPHLWIPRNKSSKHVPLGQGHLFFSHGISQWIMRESDWSLLLQVLVAAANSPCGSAIKMIWTHNKENYTELSFEGWLPSKVTPSHQSICACGKPTFLALSIHALGDVVRKASIGIASLSGAANKTLWHAWPTKRNLNIFMYKTRKTILLQTGSLRKESKMEMSETMVVCMLI